MRIKPVIDYADRVEEVANILSSEIGFTDKQAVEILLASQMPSIIRPPWLILETDYYRLDMTATWFSLLTSGEALSLPAIRTRRPRLASAEVKEMLSTRTRPRLFVESNWQMPPTVTYQFRMWPYLLQECLSLRSAQPKGFPMSERTTLLLVEAVRRAHDGRFRVPVKQTPPPPTSLFYYAEILQRLSPRLRDWDTLLRNLSALAGRRAYLFNRDVDSTDWEAVSRVMCDSVPQWVAHIVRTFEKRGKLSKLKGWLAPPLIRSEMGRLQDQGVLVNHRSEWLISDRDGMAQGIMDTINGIKFM